jgi:hypothetical protein
VFGLAASFISAEDLITNKLASGRHYDLGDVDAVRQAKEARAGTPARTSTGAGGGDAEVADRKQEAPDRQRASNDASRQAHYDALKRRDAEGRDRGGGGEDY